MLGEIVEGTPQISSLVKVITAALPDVLVLTGFDNDAGDLALAQFAARFGGKFPYFRGLVGNEGRESGLDLDGDGKLGGWADALGFGKFPGNAGMAILTRYPILSVSNENEILWTGVEGAGMPRRSDGSYFLRSDVAVKIPVFSHGFFEVDIDLGDSVLTVFASYLSPPVFDGPEDMNGLRNAAELQTIAGLLKDRSEPFALLADLNNDPQKGEGHKAPLLELLAQLGQPDDLIGLPTANWASVADPMRVDYVLPAPSVNVVRAGVVSPDQSSKNYGLTEADIRLASDHWLVWADIVPP